MQKCRVRLMYILNPDFKALNCHAIGKSRVLTVRLMYFLNNDVKTVLFDL